MFDPTNAQCPFDDPRTSISEFGKSTNSRDGAAADMIAPRARIEKITASISQPTVRLLADISQARRHIGEYQGSIHRLQESISIKNYE